LNILLTKKLEAKITDFGISKMMAPKRDQGRPLKLKRSNTMGVGSYHYMAPEVLRTQDYDEKADIYSFALIMYFISSGHDPFHEQAKDPTVILEKYGKGEEPRPNEQEVDARIRAIVKDSWAAQPSDRPEAKELAQRLHAVSVPESAPCCNVM